MEEYNPDDPALALVRRIRGNIEGVDLTNWEAALEIKQYALASSPEPEAPKERALPLNKHCGDCDRWMKSSECPREHNVNGQHKGPSCSGPICGKFLPKN